MLTSSMTRLSYARILVEIDLLEDLPQSINICLPNGASLVQQVIYENLPKFCGHCRVLWHVITSCTKAPKEGGFDQDLSLVLSAVAAVTRRKKGQYVVGEDQAADAAAKAVGLAPGSGMPPLNFAVESVGRDEFSSSSSDPMLAEVAATKGGWVSIKKKKHSSRNGKQSVAMGGLVVPPVSGEFSR